MALASLREPHRGYRHRQSNVEVHGAHTARLSNRTGSGSSYGLFTSPAACGTLRGDEGDGN